MKLFERNLIEWKEMKKLKVLIEDIKHYIEFCKIT